MSDHDRIYDLGYWTDRLTDAVHDSKRRIEETGKTTDKERLEAIADVLVDFTSCFGPEGVECYKKGRGLVIPGYFRPTKEWDLAVYSQKRLLAVIELKSMMSSVAKNLNNRTEEALGSAYDLRTAGRYGSFSGTNQPYTGYLMVLRDEESVRDVIKFQKAKLPLYDKVRDEFIGINTRDRLPLLFSKMISEKLYDKACIIWINEDGSVQTDSDGCSAKDFLTSYYGYLAGVRAMQRGLLDIQDLHS